MSSHAYRALAFEVEGRVGTITLNRPQERNCISDELKADFLHLLRELSYNRELGAIILTGAGGVFCSGGDLKFLKDGERSADWDRRRLHMLHDWVQLLMNLEIPVIAAVDGPAIGAGFGLALACDFVLCSERAYFRASFGRVGLVPDAGIMFTLPRMVGSQAAKEIVFTGRSVPATEAKDLRIALSVHTPEALLPAARDLARRLALGPTPAIGATKRIMNQSFNLDARAMVEMEASAQAIFFHSQFHHQAIADFNARRPLAYDWDRLAPDDDPEPDSR